MARKPDRFERMVEQVIGESPIMFTHETLKLLRRQHRYYMRLVRKVWAWQGEQLADNEDACEVIIQELTKYAK